MKGESNFLESIFFELLNSTKKRQIESIIQRLEKAGGKWRFFGDREMNISTIRISSDPMASLAERVTNAIDATLELYAERNPQFKKITTPRMFVEQAFKIPKGSLAELKQEKNKEHIADQLAIEIVLKEGDAERTPTIDVIDKGIGVAREEAPNTILNLNSSNKRTKKYLMGIYGQGGSTTLQFSEYVVYISHYAEKNEFWFTIVRFNPGGPDVKDGSYEYLVSSKDNLPFSVVLMEKPFDGNTLIRHINYNAGFTRQPLLLDIYSAMTKYLFDPVLPFIIKEERQSQKIKENIGETKRRIYGSRDRLNRSNLVIYKNEQIVQREGMGKFIVRYWVFKQATEQKQIETFVDPYNPIVITYYGQVHQQLPRSILKDRLKLPMLSSSMIVQVDCDELSDVGRRRMFTSTREVMTKEGQEMVKEILIEALNNDIDQLRSLDNNIRLRLIESKLTEEENKLTRKLAQLLERLNPGSEEIQIVESHRRSKSRRLPPLPTNPYPTFIRIASKSPVLQFYVSKPKKLCIESDAPDNFLTIHDEAELKIDDETKKFCSERVRSKDFKGGRFYITVISHDKPVNTKFKVKIILNYQLDGGLISLSDEREAIILPPPPQPERGKKRVEAPRIKRVKEGDPFWELRGWNDESVAEVVSSHDGVDIYVSVSNKWLKQAILRGNYSHERVKIIESRYVLFVAFHAYLQDKRLSELKNEIKLDERQIEKLKTEEQKNMAQIVASMLTKVMPIGEEIEAL